LTAPHIVSAGVIDPSLPANLPPLNVFLDISSSLSLRLFSVFSLRLALPLSASVHPSLGDHGEMQLFWEEPKKIHDEVSPRFI